MKISPVSCQFLTKLNSNKNYNNKLFSNKCDSFSFCASYKKTMYSLDILKEDSIPQVKYSTKPDGYINNMYCVVKNYGREVILCSNSKSEIRNALGMNFSMEAQDSNFFCDMYENDITKATFVNGDFFVKANTIGELNEDGEFVLKQRDRETHNEYYFIDSHPYIPDGRNGIDHLRVIIR